MRWLLIGFLVSLAALLVAAAGVARHIWLHRARLRGGASPMVSSATRGAAEDGLNEVEDIDREI